MKHSDDNDVTWIQSEVNRVFAEAVASRWRPSRDAVWRPPTDVFETDDSLVVVVEIAGLQQTDYELTVANRVLVVSGHRRDPGEKLAYHQMEIRYGQFKAQVYLPWPIDSVDRSIEATYDEGFLRVVLPKAKATRVPVRYESQDEE